jgi:hypothetical protein
LLSASVDSQTLQFKNLRRARCQWLTPVILATQETETRRIGVQIQPRQIVHKTLSQKKKNITKKAGEVAQGVGSEFKPQYQQNKTKTGLGGS